MKHCVKNIIKEFPEEIGLAVTSTPAADYLFEVRDEQSARMLPEE